MWIPQTRLSLQADSLNNAIRHVNISTGNVTTFAGSAVAGYADGIGRAAKFNRPMGIAIDPTGTFAFVVSPLPFPLFLLPLRPPGTVYIYRYPPCLSHSFPLGDGFNF